ncbi:hypothetical protein [Rhizobium sophoriradicis]|uniref:Peptidase M23 domain-containing protein n=1 Tax=Rhizobium sophoriradicis TaxID=1535245 RepID=A0A2A5KNB6_9HYPH|nr:hypothetical protein [Rhizobium sophoriradicis]PCK78477.1 hypothetical protein CPT34_24705 [Rhizobium sophoriradicis]
MRAIVCIRILAAAVALLSAQPALSIEITDLERSPVTFSYYNLGHLVPTDGGTGPNANPRFVVNPNIRLPMAINPAAGEHMYCNSQIFGYGGNGWGDNRPPSGTNSNDQRNYQFPWTTNICEIRGYKERPSVCPTKYIHQGQDCRPPRPQDQRFEAVAVEAGTSVFMGGGANTVSLTGDSKVIWNFLHMRDIASDGRKAVGAKLGKISNVAEGGTSIHLHIEAKVPLPGGQGYKHVDPLPSLIVAYQKALGNPVTVDANGLLAYDPRFEIRSGSSGIANVDSVPSSCAAEGEPSIGTEFTNSFSSLWCHNGSIVGLAKQGQNRRFVYYKPRRDLAAYVRDNPILFDGSSDNITYQGRARHYSSRCGDQLYDVSGPISPSFQFVAVSGTRKVFSGGTRPDGTPDCTFGFVQDRLEFSYIKEFEGGGQASDTPEVGTTESTSPTPDCSGVVLASITPGSSTTFDSFWFHNCSILGLQASSSGDRKLVYIRPRSELVAAAMRQPVLYRGRILGGQYLGEAIHVDDRCGDTFYAVTGPVDADRRGLKIRGREPQFALQTGVCHPLPPVESCLRIVFAGRTLAEALSKPLAGPSCPADDQSGPGSGRGDGSLNLSLDCRPKSVCSNNFAALTPKAEPEDYRVKDFGYIVDWPGFTLKSDFRDSKGFVIPGFDNRISGAGIWWYWVRKRAGFQITDKPTFRKIAKLYAGIDDDSAPAVVEYAGAYQTHSIHYFGHRVGLDEPLPLVDADTRWRLAKTMFHHEAGRNVSEVTRTTFDDGIEQAERILAED